MTTDTAASDTAVPDSAVQFGIGEMARRTGLSVDTLRYYEREQLFVAPVRRSADGRRRYDADDVDWATVCTVLRGAGMPLAEIREYTALVRAGRGTERDRLDLLRRHRERVHAQLADLHRCLDLITYKVGVYEDVLDAEN